MFPLRIFLAAALSCLSLRASAAGPAEFSVVQSRESFVSGGRRISVETFAPAAPGRFPAVLVLHSSAGTLFGKGQLEQFSASLAQRGMVAFMVRYFDRTGTIFAGDDGIEKNLHAWEDTVAGALDFTAVHPRVRRGPIGIFGYSLGAFLAVSAASRDVRVDAVAELSGGIFTYLGGHLRRVPPMLIMHGTADQRVAPSYARELERVARQLGARPAVRLFPGEGHVLAKPAQAQASAAAISFLSAQLGPKRTAKTSGKKSLR